MLGFTMSLLDIAGMEKSHLPMALHRFESRRSTQPTGLTRPGAVRKPHHSQFRENNRCGLQAGRFGFLTEPDPMRKP